MFTATMRLRLNGKLVSVYTYTVHPDGRIDSTSLKAVN